MVENNQPPSTAQTNLPTSQDVDKETERRNRQLTITITISAVIFISLIILAVFGLTRDATVTQNIRDIFIIFMALESLVIGAALVVFDRTNS